MLRFQEPPGHRQYLVDVDVDGHRVDGEVLVLLLQVFGQLVRSANLHVIGEKRLSVVTNPVEHLLAVLLK